MIRISLTAFSALVLLAACTQPPVMVDMRGSQNYERSGGGIKQVAFHSGTSPATLAATEPAAGVGAPVYYGTQPKTNQATNPFSTQSVALSDSIGVTDLAPPDAKKEEVVSINSWTNKPRDVSLSSQPEKKDSAFIWPVASHEVISGFGPKGSGKANDGINISSAQGEPVWAAADGEVVYVDSALKGYGNMVLIKHKGDKTTTYAHLARTSVAKYDSVKQGDIIGYVGATGNVKKSQLHFAVREGSDAVDPQKLIGTSVAGL